MNQHIPLCTCPLLSQHKSYFIHNHLPLSTQSPVFLFPVSINSDPISHVHTSQAQAFFHDCVFDKQSEVLPLVAEIDVSLEWEISECLESSKSKRVIILQMCTKWLTEMKVELIFKKHRELSPIYRTFYSKVVVMLEFLISAWLKAFFLVYLV